MARKRIEQRGSFEATGSDGHIYTVNIFVTILDAGHFGDPTAEMDGLKSLTTSTGMNVNRISQGEYQIVQTGVKLSTTDPTAP